MSVLSAPHFHNEEAAILHLEGILWPKGIKGKRLTYRA